MAEFDSLDEILDLAIERELEAYQLYTDMAKRAANPTLCKLFEELAEEELEHKAKLELEIIKTGKAVRAKENKMYFSMDDYDEDSSVALDLDLKAVLAFAIDKERRSVRFYLELAAVIDDRQSRDVLLSLAEEEAEHKARFRIEYEQLAAK